MSFAFRTVKDSWNKEMSIRELTEVQLFDVSVVTFPAYEETSAELRTAQTFGTLPSVAPALRKAQLRIARAKRQPQ
jgi:phage head maturation protease